MNTGSDGDFAATFGLLVLVPAVAYCLGYLVVHEWRERRDERRAEHDALRKRLDDEVRRIVVPVSPEEMQRLRTVAAERLLAKAFGPQPSNNG